MALFGTYVCTSRGPQNNKLLKQCNFRFRFEDGFTYHCPKCSSPMKRITEGKSVTDLLRQGLEKEKQ